MTVNLSGSIKVQNQILLNPNLAKKDKGGTDGSYQPNPDRPLPRVPLALILKACPDILLYCERDPKDWHELVVAAGYVHGMIGISASAWQ